MRGDFAAAKGSWHHSMPLGERVYTDVRGEYKPWSFAHASSKRQLVAADNLRLLHERGIDPHSIRCDCCGRPLHDYGKKKWAGGRIIGPCCINHPEKFPCRHHGQRS